MAKPKSVRDAAKKADDLHQRFYSQADAVASVGTGETAPKADDTILSGDDTVSGGATPTGDDTPSGAAPQQEDTIEAPSTKPEPKPPASGKPDDEETWRSRYLALKGKYDREVPDLMDQVKEMGDRMRRMENTLTSSAPPQPAQQQSQQPSSPAPSTGMSEGLATPQEIEDYGEDFLGLIERIARKAATDAVGSLTPQIEEMRGQITTTAQQTRDQTVATALAEQVPNWDTINHSPLFHEWLRQHDELSGRSYHELLLEAHSAGQAKRVVSFFKRFLVEHGDAINAELQQSGRSPISTAPQQQQQPPVQQQQPQQPQRPSLDQFAGPPAGHPSGGGSKPPTGETRTFSRAEIDQFYQDVNRGKYAKDPEAKQRKEAEYLRAANEGRVI